MPIKSHGRRNLVGCSPWGRKELDTTKRLHFHFSLSCIGEGNGNSFQCSCLENPRDGKAWWVAIYGVAQSQTRLKQLSSSKSSSIALDMVSRRAGGTEHVHGGVSSAHNHAQGRDCKEKINQDFNLRHFILSSLGDIKIC